jgi:hypothetical protein
MDSFSAGSMEELKASLITSNLTAADGPFPDIAASLNAGHGRFTRNVDFFDGEGSPVTARLEIFVPETADGLENVLITLSRT